MLDSFKARLNDSIRMNCQPPSQWLAYVCRDTNNVTIFGSSRQARTYSYNGFEGGHGRRYAKGIGPYLTTSSGIEGGTYLCNRQMSLLGCVINGLVYGDTGMLVGIQQISAEVPSEYSLSQNYPNPFNPKTVISFQLAVNSFASLKVYDLLGREVATLVNEQLSPGTYEVDWDGSNFSSGIYYYTLQTEGYSETRKMVVMK